MIKRIITLFLSAILCCCLAGCFEKPADTLSDLADVNDKEIYLMENDIYVPYIVLDNDYKGNILLLRKELMSGLRSVSDHSSEYENSPIDKYLSSDFLAMFSDEISNQIISTEIEVTSKEALYQAGKDTHTITRKVFLLSFSEVNYDEHSMAAEEGVSLSYFSDEQSRIAYKDGKPCSWWLRTPYTNYDSVTWSVGADGMKTELSSATENGIRPAFCLSGDVDIKESTDVIDGETVFVIE